MHCKNSVKLLAQYKCISLGQKLINLSVKLCASLCNFLLTNTKMLSKVKIIWRLK